MPGCEILACPWRRIGVPGVALGHFQVMRTDGPGPLQLLGRDPPDHLARDTHDHGPGRDAPALRDDGACGDEAILADLAAAEEPGPDADERVLADAPAVQDGPVAHDDTLV